MVTIKKQLVSSRATTFPGTNGRKFITIHETANYQRGANAQMHANLQTNGFSASWHWQVDDKIAIQSYPHTVRCWHAGDGTGNGNYHSIAIEICVNADGDYRKAVSNAAALVKKIMSEEGISLINVTQHNHWSGKDCPLHLRRGDKGINWSEFKRLVTGSGTSGVAAKASTTVLSYGSTGTAVKLLQEDLNKLGYKLAVDSSFGPATEKAVRSFQTAHQLTSDGIVGPKTKSALETALLKGQSTQVSALKYGDRGNAVRQLQMDLNKLGYNLTVDAQFGPATERTIKAFQKAYKIKVDGFAGPETQTALKRAIQNSTTFHAPVLRYGSKGEMVRQLQTDLNKLGYKLIVDSQYGPATEKAVRSFQQSYHLIVDGIAGPKTWATLKTATSK